jgi:hypothetical protein
MSHSSEEVTLTASEQASIQDSSGAPGRLSRSHFEAIERIIAARVAEATAEALAFVDALAADSERLASEHFAKGKASRAGAHAGVAQALRDQRIQNSADDD